MLYTCPHCRKARQPARHLTMCPHQPELRAVIVATLTDPDRPGYALTNGRYGIRAPRMGAPSKESLCHAFGSWVEVVAEFGLRPASEWNPPIVSQEGERRRTRVAPERTSVCPHCGKAYAPGNLKRHIVGCPLQPAIMEIVRQLATADATAGIGVNCNEYQRRFAAYRAQQPEGAPMPPTMNVLRTHLGEWRSVLNACGLMSEDDMLDARVAADNERYRTEWRIAHAAEVAPLGLPVTSPQKPTPVIHADRVPAGYVRIMVR
jgi:hypothetical protein